MKLMKPRFFLWLLPALLAILLGVWTFGLTEQRATKSEGKHLISREAADQIVADFLVSAGTPKSQNFFRDLWTSVRIHQDGKTECFEESDWKDKPAELSYFQKTLAGRTYYDFVYNPPVEIGFASPACVFIDVFSGEILIPWPPAP